MLTLRSGPMVGLLGHCVLLTTLAATVGVTTLGWIIGVTCAVVINGAVARGVARSRADALGPADLVTLTRAMLACAVAALVADSWLHEPALATLLTLTVVALVLDAVDGWVARHTRTASVFGARFDGEVDAFLMLVLSVYVARTLGWWVLAIGVARYAFAVAGWVFPWLRGRLPARYWRKVVTATQGIVLTVAAADVVPRWVAYVALVVALAMLTESFGRDVWWLWSRRPDRREVTSALAGQGSTTGNRKRNVAAILANTLALALVWFALVAPNQTQHLTPSAFFRIPVEGLALAGLALVLPSWARRAMAVLAGTLLGLVAVVKVLDMGFFTALDRPFNVVTDRGYFSPVRVLVRDAIGPVAGDIVLAAAVILAVTVLVGMPLSLGRLTALVVRHRSRSVGTVTGLAVIWVACAAAGLQVPAGEPFAAANAGRIAVDQVRAMTAAVRDRQEFDAAVALDPFADTADADLLTALRGKDVLIAFVESYGRVAIDGSPSSPEIRAILDAGSAGLRASGYSSRSAYLTSPTLGGLSWLAHSTLQSGLWVSDQGRYDRLLAGDRASLSGLFRRAGWRTVTVMPASREEWPEGERFYGFDKLYDRRNIDYNGPTFGFAGMPDQYALAALRRLELEDRDRAPVMAVLELASSHAPWAPLPELIDWNRLGDGEVFDPIYNRARSATELWRDSEKVEQAYADSIEYALGSLISFVEEYGDKNLVLIVVGDHQPATVISGHGASRDVPVTMIAHDRSVLDRISHWGWQDGLTPDSRAPVWRMDAFRDRFLVAFSPGLEETP